MLIREDLQSWKQITSTIVPAGHKVVLTIERLAPRSIGTYLPSGCNSRAFVLSLSTLKQHVAQITLCFGIGYRGNNLNAVFEVSRHPVGMPM
jgi:hypothetical protein